MLSIAEEVAKKLRGDILSGAVPPGTRLREIEVCKRLSVSRTPVREAFRILQSEGFLTYRSNQGVEVNAISADEIPGLIEIRKALEALAARSAARSITEELLRDLRNINAALRNASTGEEAARADEAFHTAIAAASQNAMLVEQMSFLLLRYAVIDSLLPHSGERISLACKEHGDILDAIATGDGELAAKYMEVHFNTAADLAEKALQQWHGSHSFSP